MKHEVKKLAMKVVPGVLVAAAVFSALPTTVSASELTEENHQTLSQKSYDFEESLSTISVQSVGNLEIKTGDTLKVECSYPEEYIPKVECKDHKLTIEQEAETNLQHIQELSTAFRTEGWETVITVPADCQLSKTTVNSALGDVDLENLSSEKLNVCCAVGDLVFDEGTYDSVKLEAAIGDVEGYDVTMADGSIQCAIGDVELLGNIGNLDYVTTGSVMINGENLGGFFR